MAARGLVLALLGSPAAASPLPDPTAAGVEFVSLQARGEQLGKVVEMLREGTGRCLTAQARMINALAVRGFDLSDAEKPTSVRPAWNRLRGLQDVHRRSVELREERQADIATDAARGMLADDAVTEGDRTTLLHHLGLREACLNWADRSVEMLSSSISGAPRKELTERMRQVRDMAANDDARIHSLASGEIPLDRDAIEAMDSYGHRP